MARPGPLWRTSDIASTGGSRGGLGGPCGDGGGGAARDPRVPSPRMAVYALGGQEPTIHPEAIVHKEAEII